MTRHELKEQLQHDRFTDAVSGAVDYAASHRRKLILWSIVGVVIAAVIGAAVWYTSYQRSIRRQALESALTIAQAPVGPAAQAGPGSYPTEQAKRQAAVKALSDLVSKYGGSREGLIAQYNLGTIKVAAGDTNGAEADLKTVAGSSSEFAPLAKMALAQLYVGQNRVSEAQALVRGIADKGSDLVSKAQAQVFLAQLDQTADPQQAKKILQSLKADKDPAVARAVEQLSSGQAK